MNLQALPEWTEQKDRRGQDPLGMQNSSTTLYQALLPGISNVTLRMRYYGYYAWLSHIYAHRIGNTNPDTWRRFLRRAEALYALVAFHQGEEYNVAGVEWAKRKLAEEPSHIDFAADANPDELSQGYLKQKWGAYGAAYGSQLYVTGVLIGDKNHDIPLPEEDIGEALARAFQEALGDQLEPIYQAIASGCVTARQLRNFALMLPSSIDLDSEERSLYENLILARLPGLPTETGVLRRKTLELILFLVHQFGEPLDANDVRWALYSGHDLEGELLRFPEALATHRQAWWVYQLNDLAHFSLETLLQYVLDSLDATPQGLAIDSLIGRVVGELCQETESPPDDWETFLDANILSDIADALEDDVPERSLVGRMWDATKNGGLCTSDTAWCAVRLLACLHHRSRTNPNAVTDHLNPAGVGQARSVLTEVAFLEQHRELPFREMLGRLIQERVVRRHLWVAMRKLRYQRDYTFLLEVEDGRVRKRKTSGPTLTNPRLAPAITFLYDIGLLDDDGITPQGEQCLGELL